MDRRVGKTKKAIQAAYFDLLKEKGNEKISVTEIARAADIDRKTFYLHYESTDQIIREFAKAKTKELLARNPNLSFFWSQVQDTSVEMLVEIYARHSKLPKSDLTIRVTYFVAGASSVYQRWLRGEIPCSLEELGEKASEIAFYGAQSLLQNS